MKDPYGREVPDFICKECGRHFPGLDEVRHPHPRRFGERSSPKRGWTLMKLHALNNFRKHVGAHLKQEVKNG